MKILSFTFETTLTFSEPVSDHDFVLRCTPHSTPSQTVLDSQLIITPPATIAPQADGFGNVLSVGRLEQPHSEFNFISSGLVMVDAPVQGGEAAAPEAPETCHPMFLRESTFAAADADISAFAGDVLRVVGNAPAFSKAQRLSQALHARFVYEKGLTDVGTTAAQAFALGRGVCQDYAHILIAACRAAGIPARYVGGLMLGEGATHAWVEVFDGQRWCGIDPTNDKLVDDDYIAIVIGRDFADCPIESGVFRGGARQSQAVTVAVSTNES